MPRNTRRRSILILGCLASLASPGAWSASRGAGVTGRQAVSAVRHDWKKSAGSTVRTSQASAVPIPRNFGSLSAAQRLAILHARRDLNAARFDRYHPRLGVLLARDDRLRAAQGVNCLSLNGLLPDNAHYRYLHQRRNLNPARFDRYHPALGALLAEDDLLRAGDGCVLGELIVPPTIPTPPGTPSPNPPFTDDNPLPPRAVPEPASLALTFIGLGGIAGFRMIRRRRGA